MFTGIVEAIGCVRSVEAAAHGAVLRIDAPDWDHRPRPGESVAVAGCCLTATADGRSDPARGELRFDVVRETLDRTNLGDLRGGSLVNLEPSVTLQTLMSGHIVQGHVDGVGLVQAVSGTQDRRVAIAPPRELMRYVVEKGSIAVDGVSLTVAALRVDSFEIALVPTTIAMTTMGRVQVGDRVNLETDYLVKAIARLSRGP